jgi:hypothetical protein
MYSPDERFADAYAACARRLQPGGRHRRNGVRVGDWATAYGYYPIQRTHRRICTAIVVLALAREQERPPRLTGAGV